MIRLFAYQPRFQVKVRFYIELSTNTPPLPTPFDTHTRTHYSIGTLSLSGILTRAEMSGVVDALLAHDPRQTKRVMSSAVPAASIEVTCTLKL